jgi:glutaconate CoA-transferase subunit B
MLRFSPEGEAYLHSYHPGMTVDDILTSTGWPLAVSPDVHETPSPTKKELRVIRAYDPDHFWTK